MKKFLMKVFAVVLCCFMVLPVQVSAGEQPIGTTDFTVTNDDYLIEILEKKNLKSTFEIESLREANVKHYYMPDGSIQMNIYATPIHELNAQGAWDEIAISDLSQVYASDSSTVMFEETIYDTYTKDLAEDTNYGNSTTLWVGTHQIAYIKTELPTIPRNATIQSANLLLNYWFNNGEGTGSLTAGVHEATIPWEDDTLTWTNSGTNQGLSSYALNVQTMEGSASYTATTPGQIAFDITAPMTWWYLGKPNYGLGIKYQSGTSNVLIRACEYGPTYQPRFTVTYTLSDLSIVNQLYFIRNQETGTYVRPDSAGGQFAKLTEYGNNDYQSWICTYLHNGYYKLTSLHTGKALTAVESNMTGSESAFALTNYSGSTAQQWSIVETSSGNYKLSPRLATHYCAVAGSYGSDDLQFVENGVYSNDADLSDEWMLTEVFPLSGYEIEYDPSIWNASPIMRNTNCYSYALNTHIHPSSNYVIAPCSLDVVERLLPKKI